MATIDFIRPSWPTPQRVRARVTTRDLPGHSRAPFDRFNLGARSGDDAEAVARNRQALQTMAGFAHPPHWLDQVHGIDVVHIRSKAPLTQEPKADAAVTSIEGAVLAVLTADCLPVFFAARDGSEVAVAHAGWRGLAHGVLEATVAALRTAPVQVIAWLGPAAGPARYEIGEEVRAAFVDHDTEAATCFISTRPGHWLIDLHALARRRLNAAGVTDIHGGTFCTIGESSRFYSYRRDGTTGRMASLIWIQE